MSYLHKAVVFSCFRSFARCCNSTFFTSILAIGKRMKFEFYQVDSVFKLYKLVSVGKKFYLVELPKLSVFFCPTVFLIIIVLSVLIHFMLKLENLIIVVERNSEQKERKKGEGLRIPRGQP